MSKDAEERHDPEETASEGEEYSSGHTEENSAEQAEADDAEQVAWQDLPGCKWVGCEPQLITSRYAEDGVIGFFKVEDMAEGAVRHWESFPPDATQRICSAYRKLRFPMYEFAFKEVGMRLPFNDFEIGIFNFLRAAPSQLHPNALAFIRAFQHVCEFLKLGATIPLFFRCFRVHRQGEGPRHTWISLRNSDTLLFKIHTESIKDFKDRFYLIKPLTHTALHTIYSITEIVDQNGEAIIEENGNPAQKWVPKLRLHWVPDHYGQVVGRYHFSSADLNEDDLRAYSRICQWVDGFYPTQWYDRQGEPVIINNQHVFEPRVINTKRILDCETHAERMTLLGNRP